MSYSVLVLNRSYEPLGHTSWQRAITLVCLGKVETLEEYEAVVRSPHTEIKVPAVIRLTHDSYIRPINGTKFNRENIFARDGYVCQYCTEKFSKRELTFDHIVPIAQGGRKTWENIVTSCKPCNAKKKDRTPEQARMRLLKKPRKPVWSHVISIAASVTHTPKEWREYLYQVS